MATSVLTLSLFGPFRVAIDDVLVTGFPTDKVRALLAYLAIETDRPHPRSSLATLLWPDMPEEIALRNLRKTLHRLQQTLAASLAPTEEGLFLATRQVIQLNQHACSVDVAGFQARLSAVAAHSHRHLHLCLPCLDRLDQAVALYRGELLSGFALPDAEPFEEWLLLRREMLLHQVLQRLYDLAAAYLERQEYERAYTYATRQVELDPGREEAHRQVLLALELNGQRSEALAYFERCRRMLLETLGVEPAAETLDLVNQFTVGSPSGPSAAPPSAQPSTSRPTPASHLPAQFTPFFGRTTELLQIAEYFRDPDCRLVSILGPGGVGKTRLAVRAADQLTRRARFPDGIVFFPLAEIGSTDLLPATLVSGLGLNLDGGSDSRAQLLRALGPRDCLLVLDNMEHLLEAVDLLVDILRAAPRVCLFVTSRLPLDLRAEQRVYLEGLDYPGQIALTSTSSGLPPLNRAEVEVADSTSVQLFVQTAERVHPAFALSAANEHDILQICRLVDGLPLALELAAPWVRIMECPAIAAAIEHNLTLLTSTARDIPERHRSMEAVLAQSWHLLTRDEQAALAQLSVFRGPFDVGAAASVTGVTILDLATFVDRSLLQRTSDGLYQLHELLRQFGAQKFELMPARDTEAIHERHSSYYLGLVAVQEQTLYGPEARPAVVTLRRQIGNIRVAWEWAVGHGRDDALVGSLESMVRFWLLASLFEEAERVLGDAVVRLQGRLEADPACGPLTATLAIRLLAEQARFLEVRYKVDDAISALDRALAMAERGADREGEALVQSVLGEVLPHRGEYERARVQLERACEYFQSRQQLRRLARALSHLGIVYWRSDDYARAIEHLVRARSMLETLDDRWGLARVLYALGGVAFQQGDLDGALRYGQETLRLYDAMGDRRNSASVRGSLALAYCRLERYDLALELNQQDREMSREVGDRHGVAITLGNRGWIYQVSGDLERSVRCLEEALQIEEELGNAWDTARHRAALARVHHLRGERDRAGMLYALALPVLRDRGAPYYSVGPLLNTAELRLELGHVHEATALLDEGTALARELGIEDEIARGQALAATIAEGLSHGVAQS
jgi:predicted ATPase/DNA-binding SARP family transcriptional activator